VCVDSHCHLDDADFDTDRDVVITRAHEAGLRYLLTIGGASGPDSIAASVPLADAHDWIWTAAGIHPHEASKAEERHFDELRRLARHPKFVAIGEIGLDYYYDHSPRDVQQQVLVQQLELAWELKLPVIIHCRDAWSDLRSLVRSHWQSAGLGGILHCFSGTREDAFELMDAGFLVSFAGNITFKKAENLRAVAREIPLDRLLTETDSPYLAPVPYRGKRNEPAFVVEVTRQLASLRQMSVEDLGRQTLQNFQRFVKRRKIVNGELRIVSGEVTIDDVQ
jgi:TatD DNase family protein